MFGKAIETIDQADNSLDLYAKHFGATSSEFKERCKEIIQILEAQVKGFEKNREPGNAAIVHTYAGTLQKYIQPSPNQK